MKKPVVTPAVLWIRAEFLLAPTSHYVFITKLGNRYTISLQLFPFVICKKLLTVQNAMYRYQYGI